MRLRGFGEPLDDELIGIVEDIAYAEGLSANTYLLGLLMQDLEARSTESTAFEGHFLDEPMQGLIFEGRSEAEAGRARFLLAGLRSTELKYARREAGL